jgi:catechol 2,3-dioxygenase-like lactoylglutathione lyase family enzyme
MADRAADEPVEHVWYTRPVLFVADLGRSIRFYDELGFRKAWHEGDGKGTVCQVERSGCEIILCEHDSRRDKSRLFVSLTKEAISVLRAQIAERSIPSKMSWWGYDVIQVDDPDGNELLFPLPQPTLSGQS